MLLGAASDFGEGVSVINCRSLPPVAGGDVGPCSVGVGRGELRDPPEVDGGWAKERVLARGKFAL